MISASTFGNFSQYSDIEPRSAKDHACDLCGRKKGKYRPRWALIDGQRFLICAPCEKYEREIVDGCTIDMMRDNALLRAGSKRIMLLASNPEGTRFRIQNGDRVQVVNSEDIWIF